VTPEDSKGARTRAAILDASARAFRDQGFEVATLEGIAAELGITRSAVLHHFSSKTEILVELITPMMGRVDELLDRAEDELPLSGRGRRRFLADLVEVMAEHRPVAALVSRDLTAQPHLGPDLQIADRAARLVEIVTEANADDPLATARALAALGALLRPLVAPDDVVDFDDAATRALLVDCAVRVLRTPLAK
jgi:AcrR family transcriptional regulator